MKRVILIIITAFICTNYSLGMDSLEDIDKITTTNYENFAKIYNQRDRKINGNLKDHFFDDYRELVKGKTKKDQLKESSEKILSNLNNYSCLPIAYIDYLSCMAVKVQSSAPDLEIKLREILSHFVNKGTYFEIVYVNLDQKEYEAAEKNLVILAAAAVTYT